MEQKTYIKGPYKNRKKYYKSKYFIVFYDETDEEPLFFFDNVREIAKFQKKEETNKNLTLINVEIYRALKREDHLTEFLNGSKMHLYIIDATEEEDDDFFPPIKLKI